MTTSEEFTQRAVVAASDLSLYFVGATESEITSALRQVQSNLESNLADAFGPDIAADIAKAFVTAVADRQREIESACTIPNSEKGTTH